MNEIPASCNFIKSSRAHELIGVVLVSNSVDHQGDALDGAALRDAATWYLNNSRATKFNHDGADLSKEDIQLSESFIVPDGGMMIEGESISGGAWVCKWAISDRLHNRLAQKPPVGFSIGGVSLADQRGGVNYLRNLKINEISILTRNGPAVPGAVLVSLKSKEENNQMTNEQLKSEIEQLTSLCEQYLIQQAELIEPTARMIVDIADEISDKAIEKLKRQMRDGKITYDPNSHVVRYMGREEVSTTKQVTPRQEQLELMKRWNPKAYRRECEKYWKSVSRDYIKDGDQAMADDDNRETFHRRYGG